MSRKNHAIFIFVFTLILMVISHFRDYTFSRRGIYDMIEGSAIYAMVDVGDIAIFIMETKDPYFVFGGHLFRSYRQILVFSKNAITPRYRLRIHSPFNEQPVQAAIPGVWYPSEPRNDEWWRRELTFSGGFHQYLINIDGSMAQGLEINLTQDRIRPLSTPIKT